MRKLIITILLLTSLNTLVFSQQTEIGLKIENDVRWVSNELVFVKEAPDESSEVKSNIPVFTEVYVQEKEGGYVFVLYRKQGMERVILQSESRLDDLYHSGWVKEESLTMRPPTAIDRQRHQSQIRRETFVNNNPAISETFKSKILNGRVSIGMSKEMVIASLGEPIRINRTVTSNTTVEQWIYQGRMYLYIENGVLNSYQDTQ